MASFKLMQTNQYPPQHTLTTSHCNNLFTKRSFRMEEIHILSNMYTETENSKNADAVWNEINAGQRKSMTLEDFLSKAVGTSIVDNNEVVGNELVAAGTENTNNNDNSSNAGGNSGVGYVVANGNNNAGGGSSVGYAGGVVVANENNNGGGGNSVGYGGTVVVANEGNNGGGGNSVGYGGGVVVANEGNNGGGGNSVGYGGTVVVANEGNNGGGGNSVGYGGGVVVANEGNNGGGVGYGGAMVVHGGTMVVGERERGRGKRRAVVVEEPVLDKATQQKQRRMIKNRESAARSRERKQAYTMELEALVTQLEEENARLLSEEAEECKKRAKKLKEHLIPVEDRLKHEKPPKAQPLRRSNSMRW